MKIKTKKSLATVCAACMVAAVIFPGVYGAKAANEKVTVIKDDITMTTLTGGDWQVKDGKAYFGAWEIK